MSPQQILVLQSADERTNRRCVAYAEFLARLAKAEGNDPVLRTAIAVDAVAMLRALHSKGTVLLQQSGNKTWDVRYLPSYEAREKVFKETHKEDVWPKKIRSEHTNAFRSSEGAIFRFPLEYGEGSIDVFITDWSPCPAACAIAIHRAHPLAKEPQQVETAKDYFTGQYVRHPLTGDLLPVWVASFVRSDFGTGAVLVNPAHDLADLAFGREAGLPIKFALVDESYDGRPSTWPVPPVIKRGRAVRTGICDGATASDARAEYLKVLESRDLATRHTDINPGTWAIGQLVPSEVGDIGVSSANLSLIFLERGDAAPQRYAFVPIETIPASAICQPEDPVMLVCPGGNASLLLAFRLLSAEFGGPELTAVEIVQAVQGKEFAGVASKHFDLATILMSRTSETAAPKLQDLEQVARFLAIHSELRPSAAAQDTLPADDTMVGVTRKIKQILQRDGLARAFAELYRLQKQFKDKSANGQLSAESYAGYLALTEVIVGVQTVPDRDLKRTWSQL